jgi:ankyrin repeat protein
MRVSLSFLLLHGRFIDAQDAFRGTALHYAAGNGHGLVVEVLLRNRPNLLLQDKKGRTPQAYAEQNGHTNVSRILKEYSGDVLKLDITKTVGQTALIEAARLEQVEVWQLVEEETNLEARDEYGRTALTIAASGGHKMTVELLIENGAEIEARDMYGKTALMYAAQGHKAVLQLPLEKEAEVRATDDDSQTALHWAARYGYEDIVGELLKTGAILDATSRHGTALSWAANGGHNAVVRLLLKKKSKF